MILEKNPSTALIQDADVGVMWKVLSGQYINHLQTSIDLYEKTLSRIEQYALEFPALVHSANMVQKDNTLTRAGSQVPQVSESPASGIDTFRRGGSIEV